MKYLTKQWARILDALKKSLGSTATSGSAPQAIAWLERQAENASRANEKEIRRMGYPVDLDDFIEREIEEIKWGGEDFEIRVERGKRIIVKKATILKRGTSVEKLPKEGRLKGIELYAEGQGGSKVCFWIEKRTPKGKHYCYFTVMGVCAFV